jgi:predicted AlkP superfamily phosphohydrolase/phosphomutase
VPPRQSGQDYPFPMPTGMLVVGLDGACGDTITELIDSGKLPNLSRLRRAGTWGTLETLPGLGDDAAWSSFSTGVMPGRHGRFYHEQIRPGILRPIPFRRSTMTDPPFWEAFDRAGLKVAVLDVPKSPLGSMDRGVVLADWMPHGPETAEVTSEPASFIETLRAEFSARPGFCCDRLERTAEEYIEFFEWSRERLALRESLARHLLDHETWDVLVTVVAETHCLGHQCWHLHDPTHPEYARAPRDLVGDPLVRMYEEADRHVGALLQNAEPPTTVVVFSLLGMGPNYRVSPLVGVLLERLDAATPVHRPFTHFARAWRKKKTPRRRFFEVVVDYPATGVRINLQGREPEGQVTVGAEYEAVLQELEREFRGLEDGTHGGPAVLDVIRTSETFPGDRWDSFADLIVVWRRDHTVTEVYSERLGRLASAEAADRSGNHRPGGWFIAVGPGFEELDVSQPARLVDLTATIGAAVGVPLENIDGQVIMTRPSKSVRAVPTL